MSLTSTVHHLTQQGRCQQRANVDGRLPLNRLRNFDQLRLHLKGLADRF